MSLYSSDYLDPEFGRWFNQELNQYEQSVLLAAIERILEVQGPDICSSEFGKNLKDGLYEFRVRQSLNAILNFGKTPDDSDFQQGGDQTVLLRVFVHFHGAKIILLLHGLNKGNGDSEKRQQKEIGRARKLLTAWKLEQRRLAKRKK